MTVRTAKRRHRFQPGDAMAVEAIPFPYLGAESLSVSLRIAGRKFPLVRDVDYALGGDGAALTGVIQPLRIFAVDQWIEVLRVTSIVQDTQIRPLQPFPAVSAERTLDRSVMAMQEIADDTGDTIARAIMVPEGEIASTLPPAMARRGMVLTYNELTGAQEMRAIGSFPPGPPGPAGNVAATLNQLKYAPVSNRVMIAAYDESGASMTWTAGDFSATPAARLDRDIVESATRPLSQGAWLRPQRSIYAGDYGVRGDRVTDDTVAWRNVIIAARALGIGIVKGGYMRSRVKGPLVFDGVGLVFEQQGFNPGEAGLYAEGSGYTVVTVRGFVSDFVCGIYPNNPAAVTLDGNNQIISDTRPDLRGFQLSGDVQNGVCALSYLRWLRVVNLRRGVLVSTMWDTTIEKMSVEFCGGTGANDYAVDIEDGEPGQTTNESVIHHLHVEHSIHRAIRITGNLLSCAIHKIHSERAYAVAGVTTWQMLGGGCDYGPARLNASVNGNPAAPKGTAVIGGAGTVFRSTRIEDAMASYSVLQNGTVTLIEPYMALTASPGQNGALTVIGGVVAGEAIDGYATFYGTAFPSLSVGFAAPGAATKLVGCRVASLTAASNQAAVDLHDCGPVPINPLMFRSIRALGATELRPIAGNSLSFGYQYLLLDTAARIAADTNIDFCGFDWRGTIVGAVTFTTAMRTVVGADAKASGLVSGFLPPTGAEYIGPRVNGLRTKNPAWMPGATPGWLYATANSAWHPEPVVA